MSKSILSKNQLLSGGVQSFEPERALISNSSGKIAVSEVTSGELATLQNIRSNVQDQIDAINLDGVSNKITNCITEIPQDIKLELNNGTLTLKAGSVITYPDGTQVQTTADKTISSTSNGQLAVFMNPEKNAILVNLLTKCSSGTSAPTDMTSGSFYIWFDTTSTVIKRTNNAGSSWINDFSLPLAIVTVSNGAISSIDQVFNGFGYIGSTIFVLPGVKHLYAQGFNSDGTLHSVEHTVPSVYTRTETGSYTKVLAVGGNIGLSDYIYDEATNYLYANNSITIANRRPELTVFATASATTGGKITSFTPKSVIRLATTDMIEDLDVPSLQSRVSQLETSINLKADDADVVHKANSETITGQKTFTSAIQRTAPLGSGGSALFNCPEATVSDLYPFL